MDALATWLRRRYGPRVFAASVTVAILGTNLFLAIPGVICVSIFLHLALGDAVVWGAVVVVVNSSALSLAGLVARPAAWPTATSA